MTMNYFRTGQERCYDSEGSEIPCAGSGQDGESRMGRPWPEPRFTLRDELVEDRLTSLEWYRDANPNTFPVTWSEALAAIAELNRQQALGYSDWRLPNRRELRSLMSYQSRKPALPPGHPFVNLFQGWYWTSTSAAINPAYAWYVHLEGARMFYGRKDQYYLFWPVRGTPRGLPQTGQDRCYDSSGQEIACSGEGQDGELRLGTVWPEPRFAEQGELVRDQLTGLIWLKNTDQAGRLLDWRGALELVARLNLERHAGVDHWHLPNINQLESLVDCRRAQPALSSGHPFVNIREGYWSSTTSFFETDWAWVLYLHKGALGVGHKSGVTFHAWPVAPAGNLP
jgi:hypothetical protein